MHLVRSVAKLENYFIFSTNQNMQFLIFWKMSKCSMSWRVQKDICKGNLLKYFFFLRWMFYSITQWSCRVPGSLWGMLDSNLGPLPLKPAWCTNNKLYHISQPPHLSKIHHSSLLKYCTLTLICTVLYTYLNMYSTVLYTYINMYSTVHLH